MAGAEKTADGLATLGLAETALNRSTAELRRLGVEIIGELASSGWIFRVRHITGGPIFFTSSLPDALREGRLVAAENGWRMADLGAGARTV